jgi:hypothetical protein
MPIRKPITVTKDRLEEVMQGIARLLSTPVIVVVVAACAAGAPSTVAPSVAAPASVEPSQSAAAPSAASSVAPSAAPSASASPVAFTSKTYGYSLTLPGNWTTIQATAAWNGKGAPFHDVPEADQFVGPPPASAWFFGAPTKKDLAARVKESIAANAAEHGNTCPPVPSVQEPIEIGGEPGVFLAFNCGILINNAITVHDGMAYLFGFRDPAVHDATSPKDRAVFLEMLKSVTFPS